MKTLVIRSPIILSPPLLIILPPIILPIPFAASFMTEKKRPVNWTSLAEKRIREAQAAGEFENLPGFGKPIPGIDEPYDENWWVKEKLRREQISALPPALEIARDKERTLAAVARL